MVREVILTRGAERDLGSIVEYIAESDGPRSASHVLDRLSRTIEGLVRFPERGSYPKELSTLGIREYRQVHFKPYRIIYRVLDARIVVHIVADSRRDVQTLLARRLLG